MIKKAIAMMYATEKKKYSAGGTVTKSCRSRDSQQYQSSRIFTMTLIGNEL